MTRFVNGSERLRVFFPEGLAQDLMFCLLPCRYVYYVVYLFGT